MKRAHRQAYRAAAAQMRALAGVRRDIRMRDPAARSKYLREFNSAFRAYDRALKPEELDERLAAASIVLVGDYHALPASQNFAAGLLERLSQANRVVLGIEAVLSRDQPILDAWWRREITEHALRQQLRFDDEWGYDWEPFYELLISAREHCEGIYGLDCTPRDDLRRIRFRDRHAAARISDIRQRHPSAMVVVLFGESHMAPQHLPAELSRILPQERVLSVLQNLDSLYWQATDENACAVDLGRNAVCVFNSSPLEKFESYRLALERWNAMPDEPADFGPTVCNLILSLARTLGFRLNSPQNGTQPKRLADSLPEVITVEDSAEEFFAPSKLAAELVGSGPMRSRLEQVRLETVKRLQENACVYVPAANRFYVREFRLPQIAGEAARFLHLACRGGTNTRGRNLELENALAYFGSRLICPMTNGDSEPAEAAGEALYRAYVGGQISEAGIRRLFLTETEGTNWRILAEVKVR